MTETRRDDGDTSSVAGDTFDDGDTSSVAGGAVRGILRGAANFLRIPRLRRKTQHAPAAHFDREPQDFTLLAR